jgi:hypothetical protein
MTDIATEISEMTQLAHEGGEPLMTTPVVGTNVQGPPESAPHEPPAWWADALITD